MVSDKNLNVHVVLSQWKTMAQFCSEEIPQQFLSAG